MMYTFCMSENRIGNLNEAGSESIDDAKAKSEMKSASDRRLALTVAAVLLSALLAVYDGYSIGRIVGEKRFDPSKYIVEIFEPEADYEEEMVRIAEDVPIVNLAMEQIGNKGGDKYWSWYGFGYRVPWCACFTSWCADELGYLDAGMAPMFAGVGTGIDWFMYRDQWLEAGATPSAGDLIFFDWEQDGLCDHVGIVTSVVDDKVFAVEGNSSDRCRVKRYFLNDPVICGYGHIDPGSEN